MPKVGDTVQFHFVPTSACFDGCKASLMGKRCGCVEKRFVARPAVVLATHEDDKALADMLDLDVEFEAEDIAAMALSKYVLDDEGNQQVVPLKLEEYLKLGRAVHHMVPKAATTPTEPGHSGTWTE